MGRKLFVGNLDSNVTPEDLASLFGRYGTVENAQVVSDRGGEGSGHGYVEMRSEEEAAAAASALDGVDSLGRTLSVNDLDAEFGDRSGEWPGRNN
jgi:RNA recognition motif-containing protein